MIITAIKQAKKHQFEVVFDDESVFLDKDTVVKNGLKIGQNFDDESVAKLRYESECTRATSKAMWLVSRRDYSKKEMILRLKKDGFDIDAVNDAVELLSESSVIDDERFAYNFAYNLKANRKLGRRAIVTELLLKGVSREIAEEVSAEFCDNDSDVETAKEIIESKYCGFDNDEKINRRMIAALARKGYSYDIVKKAIAEIENERDYL